MLASLAVLLLARSPDCSIRSSSDLLICAIVWASYVSLFTRLFKLVHGLVPSIFCSVLALCWGEFVLGFARAAHGLISVARLASPRIACMHACPTSPRGSTRQSPSPKPTEASHGSQHFFWSSLTLRRWRATGLWLCLCRAAGALLDAFIQPRAPCSSSSIHPSQRPSTARPLPLTGMCYKEPGSPFIAVPPSSLPAPLVTLI